jgi:signal transduction histidine kinase
MNTPPPSLPSLLQLLWRAYLRSALIPIIFIELALVGAYLGTNHLIREANIDTTRRLAVEQLRETAWSESALIAQQLAGVHQATELFRQQTEHAYATPYTPDAEEQARYGVSPKGVFHTTRSLPGRASVFYSALTRVGEAERAKVLQLAQLDPLMKGLVESQPLVTQVYVNTRDSMNRIYPAMDVLSQYAPDMDIPSYNFFYEADAAHNPARRVVWTDVYIDPAGQGWMTSAIAPVYLEDGKVLEAVVGLDVTVSRIVDTVLALRLPWAGYGVLIDKSGTILALPPAGEEDWGLRELTSHSYQEAITQDTFKPDAFNLKKRKDSRELVQKMEARPADLATVELHGRRKLVAWSTVEETGWKLLVVVDEEALFAEAQALNIRFNRVGLGMLATLALFYLLFFLWLYGKARVLSAALAAPLTDLEGTMQRIGDGQYTQPPPRYEVAEFQRTGEGLVRMGQTLGQSNQALREARENLEQLNLELEERIHHRTRELEQANAALNVENTEKQSLIHQLQEAQAQLIQSEKVASIGQLAAGVAHEINNPLAYIASNIEFMDQFAQAARQVELAQAEVNAQLPPEHGVLRRLAEVKARTDYDFQLGELDSIIQESREGAQRVKQIVEHLREFSTMGREVHWGELDLHRGLESALRRLHGELTQHRIQVVKDYGELPRVEGLEQQLGQVFLHLLLNGVQSMPDGGELHLQTRQEGSQVRVSIHDTGPGVTPEILHRIFDPFFTTKPVGSGTGLGLTLSLSIIRKHHGRLEVESPPGKGATFHVWLPVRQAQGPEEPPQP